MNKDFYRAFEAKYRGSRELIKSRQRVYMPFVELLKNLDGPWFAVDLGCGRGEWLELLRDAGIVAHGIDLDDGMLDDCRELGLSVEIGEAISCLKGLPDESHNIISGFHLAEHLPFSELQTLVQEALRVLKPAGLLILETPNPENIVVGTTKFYFDPTHQRPIPSELLSFLPEFYGYARTKVLRLQESKELADNMSPTLNNVFDGVSPDYTVIAQKTAPEKTLSLFDKVFSQEYGLSFRTLAERFDTRLQQVEVKAQQAEAASDKALTQLQEVLTSTSWRITSPMRSVATAMHRYSPGALKPRLKLLLQRASLYIGRQSQLKRAVRALLKRLPVLSFRFRRIINMYNPYRLLNTQTPELANVLLTEPGDEKYIPDKLRVSSLVEKDVNRVTIIETILKLRYEHEKKTPQENKLFDSFDVMMEKIRNEYDGK
jgi:O-antigen chain-terminating methyltransferase